ncbi:MAG: KGG domain-containing protein [Pseudomonadota bacterium]
MPTQGNSKSGSNRGFASMDEKKQKEIASKGGKASHAKGTGHEFSSSEAVEAGRKGGLVTQERRANMNNNAANNTNPNTSNTETHNR